MSNNLEERGGVEPHPALHQDPVFKAGRRTNAPASLSYYLAYPLGLEPRLTVLETAMLPLHYGYKLVEMIGIEPIMTEVGGFTVPCHTITAASPKLFGGLSRN